MDVLASAPGKTMFDNDDVMHYHLLTKCKFALPGALGGWSGKLTALRWLLGGHERVGDALLSALHDGYLQRALVAASAD